MSVELRLLVGVQQLANVATVASKVGGILDEIILSDLMKKRNHEKYIVTSANTERYRKSAIPSLQRLLNDDYRKQKKDLKSLLQVNNTII